MRPAPLSPPLPARCSSSPIKFALSRRDRLARPLSESKLNELDTVSVLAPKYGPGGFRRGRFLVITLVVTSDSSLPHN